MGSAKKQDKKKQPERQGYVRFCPECKSIDVELTMSSLGGTARYVCNQCGFTSSVFPEIAVSKLDILGQIKK